MSCNLKWSYIALLQMITVIIITKLYSELYCDVRFSTTGVFVCVCVCVCVCVTHTRSSTNSLKVCARTLMTHPITKVVWIGYDGQLVAS